MSGSTEPTIFYCTAGCENGAINWKRQPDTGEIHVTVCEHCQGTGHEPCAVCGPPIAGVYDFGGTLLCKGCAGRTFPGI
jgi:hypothetical protein